MKSLRRMKRFWVARVFTLIEVIIAISILAMVAFY